MSTKSNIMMLTLRRINYYNKIKIINSKSNNYV